MARISNVQGEADLSRLRTAVQTIFGKKILTHSDCETLSKDIHTKLKVSIGSQTIRRFFKLIKSNTGLSFFTLDSFSKYAGYAGWESFIHSAFKGKEEQHCFSPEEIILIENFYSFEIEEWRDNNYYYAAYNMAKLILQKGMSWSLFKFLASNKTSQVYFFEMFVCIDNLNKNYGEGINLYLKERKDKPAHVFGNSLNYLKAFLANDKPAVEKYYKYLKQEDFDASLHPILNARLIGTHILYYKGTNEKLKEYWLLKAKQLADHFYNIKSIHANAFPGYFYFLCDYMLLAGEYEFALEILKRQKTVTHYKSLFHHVQHYEQVKIMEAYALAFTGRSIECKTVLKGIDKDNTWFFYKKYYDIRYLLLQLHLTGRNALIKRNKLTEQIEMLIEDTGFSYFNKTLENYR